MTLAADGFLRLPADTSVKRWAKAAYDCALSISQDPAAQATHLRHGKTWFVGVDALPNAQDGRLNDVPLDGPWRSHVPNLPLHPAQLSIIYAGYPKQDVSEPDANHRYRLRRGAAHVDGLLPVGPHRRRFAREYHAYILGIPLNACPASPTLVWPRSHLTMASTLRTVIGDNPIQHEDLTEPYQKARRTILNTVEPIPLHAAPGESFLIHRHALHGTAPWNNAPHYAQGRMIAFFRPSFADAHHWLHAP